MTTSDGQPARHASDDLLHRYGFLGVTIVDEVTFRLYAVEWELRARLGDISLTISTGRSQVHVYLTVAELEHLGRALIDAGELAEVQLDQQRGGD